MSVGWKKNKTVDRTEHMTSMELARHERIEHERRKKAREFAIQQTNKRAEELFKQVPRILTHARPTSCSSTGVPDQYQMEYDDKATRQWEFECLAVIKLAREDMQKSFFARKYAWNADWKTTGKLQMGKVHKEDEGS